MYHVAIPPFFSPTRKYALDLEKLDNHLAPRPEQRTDRHVYNHDNAHEYAIMLFVAWHRREGLEDETHL